MDCEQSRKHIIAIINKRTGGKLNKIEYNYLGDAERSTSLVKRSGLEMDASAPMIAETEWPT
jgi:hypothetical protein